MHVVENISEEEQKKISFMIGEAFVSNELFHEFGTIQERRPLVLKYMDIYVQCAIDSKILYQTEDGNAFIGLQYSDEKHTMSQLKMLARLVKAIPLKTIKRFMNHIKQISDGNQKYTKDLYLEVMMVCVSKECQGKGRARELVEFAKEMALKRDVPLIFDTDMKDYAKIYEHLGCTLYNQKTASNGVTRYNLVWNAHQSMER